MVRASQGPDTDLAHQLDEAPPATVAAGIGIQYAVLFLGSMILNTVIVFRAAGAADDAIAWTVFISLLIGGAITALHAFPLGRLGGGHVLVTGSTAAAIAISVDALELGGPGLLAALMVVSAFFQFLFSMRLSLFRRILTPTVSGTIILLIPVTVMPIILGRLDDVPSGSSASTALACALATIVLLAGISFRGTRTLRPWAPVIGLVGGALVGGFLGLYDLGRVAKAPWIGVPGPAWSTLEALSSARRSGAFCPRFCSSRSRAPFERSARRLPSRASRGVGVEQRTFAPCRERSRPTLSGTCSQVFPAR